MLKSLLSTKLSTKRKSPSDFQSGVLEGRGWSTGSTGKLHGCISPKVCPITLMWVGHPICCLPLCPLPLHKKKNPSCLELTEWESPGSSSIPSVVRSSCGEVEGARPHSRNGVILLQSGAPGAQSSQSGKSTYTALMPVTCREGALISLTLPPQESQGSGLPIWCMWAAIRGASLWFLPHLHPARLSLTPLCD